MAPGPGSRYRELWPARRRASCDVSWRRYRSPRQNPGRLPGLSTASCRGVVFRLRRPRHGASGWDQVPHDADQAGRRQLRTKLNHLGGHLIGLRPGNEVSAHSGSPWPAWSQIIGRLAAQRMRSRSKSAWVWSQCSAGSSRATGLYFSGSSRGKSVVEHGWPVRQSKKTGPSPCWRRWSCVAISGRPV
jgi:hypothetical protein